MTTPYERRVEQAEAGPRLALAGEIDWSNAAGALGAPEGLAAGALLELDLRAVTYFDSAALGGLFRLDSDARRAGATLRVLIDSTTALPALFEISQVARVMDVVVS